ncbi:MAG TPA: hypothetical protein VGC07_02035 [Granulicella sp.]
MGMSDEPFEVGCPDCGGILKIDPVTRAVISHTPAARKRTFEDFGQAAQALREADSRRDSLFQQSLDAQKHKDDLMEKKFAEALKKAKENPTTGKPLRQFDLE